MSAASYVDPLAESQLFDLETPPITLMDKFGISPFSVLDRRCGDWQDRKRKWLSLGFKSELGRANSLTYGSARNEFSEKVRHLSSNNGTSIFDPVICELVYRWFSRPGDIVLDPFSGGSVRGLVASTLARRYVGIDIREEQVRANQEQTRLGSDISPTWLIGDATRMYESINHYDEFDLIFSCPPYGDLEVYSDDPRDISSWTYAAFTTGHEQAIKDSVRALRPNRYAAWVIGDVRDKTTGGYQGLPYETVSAFRRAGCYLLNDFVLVDQIASAALRAERPFRSNRKAARVHQHLLVFVKGTIKDSARRVSDQQVAS